MSFARQGFVQKFPEYEPGPRWFFDWLPQVDGLAHSFSTGLVMISVASLAIELHK
jgi:hypothetical protein